MENEAPVGARGAERGGGSSAPRWAPPGNGPVVVTAATNAAFEEEPPPYSPPGPGSAQLLHPPPPALGSAQLPHPPPLGSTQLPHPVHRGPVLYPTGPFPPQGLQPRLLLGHPWPPPPGFVGGAQGGQAALTPCPGSQHEGAASTVGPSALPKDYVVESVLVTVFCCLLTGLGALIYSHETRAALGRGDMAHAYVASRKAQSLVLFSLLFGLFASISWVIYVLVVLYL
ncbi:proline rich transmembrane protein 1B [Melopsittacus undulatus]|uniref:proline rich transmembrane protein 1B n=1 Tax=Melopsittacus undulatus TaxID=13146 RepID=UPI00146F2B88|nr:proline rich transmembrane protein 1B [Melopsittacus undulatus]